MNIMTSKSVSKPIMKQSSNQNKSLRQKLGANNVLSGLRVSDMEQDEPIIRHAIPDFRVEPPGSASALYTKTPFL
jgi:hypothetical protein